MAYMPNGQPLLIILLKSILQKQRLRNIYAKLPEIQLKSLPAWEGLKSLAHLLMLGIPFGRTVWKHCASLAIRNTTRSYNLSGILSIRKARYSVGMLTEVLIGTIIAAIVIGGSALVHPTWGAAAAIICLVIGGMYLVASLVHGIRGATSPAYRGREMVKTHFSKTRQEQRFVNVTASPAPFVRRVIVTVIIIAGIVAIMVLA